MFVFCDKHGLFAFGDFFDCDLGQEFIEENSKCCCTTTLRRLVGKMWPRP